MLDHNDATAGVNEPKTARMEQRTKPRVKAQIQLAAALLGVDETTFVTSAAYDRARAAIADHQRTVLCDRDRQALLAALDAPQEPTPVLREAMVLHRTRTGATDRR